MTDDDNKKGDPVANYALFAAETASSIFDKAAARYAAIISHAHEPQGEVKLHYPQPRAASIDWATRSLAAEGIEGYEHLAVGLVTAAERFRVPVELLIVWIHDRYPGKIWTVSAWVHWCCKYADAVKRLEAEYAQTREEEEPNATTTPEHD